MRFTTLTLAPLFTYVPVGSSSLIRRSSGAHTPATTLMPGDISEVEDAMMDVFQAVSSATEASFEAGRL